MEVKPGTLLMASVQLHDGVFDQTVVLLNADDAARSGRANRSRPWTWRAFFRGGWSTHCQTR